MFTKSWFRCAFVASLIVAIGLATWWFLANPRFNAFAQDTSKPLAKPPEGQTFVGSKVCASCHLEQFMTWKQSKHAKSYEILPAKYRADAACLKCHSTGHGEKTGFENIEATPGLQGTSCEACHSQGSKHAEIAKSFGNKKLGKDEEAFVRSTIFKVQPKNVCVECHVTRGHKKHPDYEKAN